jgi:hypothetical protein
MLCHNVLLSIGVLYYSILSVDRIYVTHLVHRTDAQRVIQAPSNRLHLPRKLRVFVLRITGHEVLVTVFEERLVVGQVENLLDVEPRWLDISITSKWSVGKIVDRAAAVFLGASKNLVEDLDVRLGGNALDVPDV